MAEGDELQIAKTLQTDLNALTEEYEAEVLKLESKYNSKRQPFLSKRNNHLKNVPKFWSVALQKHPILSEIITDLDKHVLEYLKEVVVGEGNDTKLVIVFHFEPNPYFHNDVIEKHYDCTQDDLPVLTSTDISWKKPFSPERSESFMEWLAGKCDNYEMVSAIKDEIWMNPLKFFDSSSSETDSSFEVECIDEDSGSPFDSP